MKPLFNHQAEAIAFILRNKGYGALFHEIGCGKTRTALEVYSQLSQDNLLKLMVFCPLSLIDAAWGLDIKEYTNFRYLNCHDPNSKFRLDTQIYIFNFEALLSEQKILIIKNMLNANKFMCVLDESSRMKNHKAKTTKILLALRDKFTYRLIMTGTPAPNCETEYWPQLNFIKPAIVHENFYPFRNYYFHLERERRSGQKEFTSGQIYSKLAAQQMFQHGWHYAMTPTKRQDLMERIKPWAHYARKNECLDLPEQTDELRLIEMGKKQTAIYKSMKNDLITEIKNNCIVAQAALTKIMKLRQITSGFAINEKEETIEIGENPKLEELKDVLEEAGKQPAIIWCQFQHEIRIIAQLLGERAVTLYGETKDKIGSIMAFKEGRAQYLIAHPRSAGHGLTFINCSLEIFYSLDYSWELYEQARGRIHRAGQLNKCTYIHLLCNHSIDEEILSVLRGKKDATEILYRMVHDYPIIKEPLLT